MFKKENVENGSPFSNVCHFPLRASVAKIYLGNNNMKAEQIKGAMIVSPHLQYLQPQSWIFSLSLFRGCT